ncbi:MAG: hypothetical protein ACR65T_14015 [Methylocystis sp.]
MQLIDIDAARIRRIQTLPVRFSFSQPLNAAPRRIGSFLWL